MARGCAVAAFAFESFIGCGAQQQSAKSPAGSPSDTAAKPAEKGTLAAAMPSGPSPASGRPIMDTHIHLYQVSKPGGVPWPPPKAKNLYRDILPAEYKELAKKHNIMATGIVEANPTVEEDLRILDLVKGDDFFKFLVASLEIGSPTFSVNLAKLA